MVTGSSVVVFFTAKVKITSPPVSGTAVGLAVLVTSIVGQDVGEVDGGVVVVGGFGVVVVDRLAGEDVDVVRAGVVALDPLGEGERRRRRRPPGPCRPCSRRRRPGCRTRVSRQAGDGHRLLGGGVLRPRR